MIAARMKCAIMNARWPLVTAMVLVFCLNMSPAGARGTRAENIARSNSGIVGIVSGAYGETTLRVAADLAAVLNQPDGLRILPMVGQGAVQNIDDILHLKGVDAGIVPSDVLAHIRTGHVHANIGKRIRYIAKLFNQEFHLLAGPGISSIAQLEGRKVSLGLAGSGTFITASAVFDALNVTITPVHLDMAMALEKIRSGEIAAAAIVSGKPADAISALQERDGVHLLPVPYAKPLRAAYLPARFTHKDYPGLIARGASVRAISVDTVLAVYNWAPGTARYNRVVRFTESFFERFQELKHPSRHSKWREMSLAASVPGWQRFQPVEALLATGRAMRPPMVKSNAAKSN